MESPCPLSTTESPASSPTQVILNQSMPGTTSSANDCCHATALHPPPLYETTIRGAPQVQACSTPLSIQNLQPETTISRSSCTPYSPKAPFCPSEVWPEGQTARSGDRLAQPRPHRCTETTGLASVLLQTTMPTTSETLAADQDNPFDDAQLRPTVHESDTSEITDDPCSLGPNLVQFPLCESASHGGQFTLSPNASPANAQRRPLDAMIDDLRSCRPSG